MPFFLLNTCRTLACSGLSAACRSVTAMAKDRSGVTIIDYALYLALVTLAVLSGFHALGIAVTGMFDVIEASFVASMP